MAPIITSGPGDFKLETLERASVTCTYGKNRELVDALGLVVGLLHQILVNVLEVRDGDILLEVLVQDRRVVHQLYPLIYKLSVHANVELLCVI